MSDLSARSVSVSGSDDKLPSYMTFLMQVTFNTSGSVILVPWTFATLGYLTAPVILFLIMGLTYQAQYALNEAAISPSIIGTASTLPDLIARMAGRHMQKLAGIAQALNMLLVMPAELDVTANALQYIVHAKPGSIADCNIFYALAVAGPPIVVTQFVRRFGHKTGVLAFISAVVVVTKCLLIVSSILWHAGDYASDASPVVGLGEAAQAAGTYTWTNIISALGNGLWFFAPVFINTELVAEMRKPDDVHKQLLLAAACMFTLYTVVGVVGAASWGVSVQSTINTQLPYDWAGVAVNCLLCYGAWLDYLISAIIFAGYVQKTFEPGFDEHDFSMGACGRWFLYSLPGNLCAVLLICFVPHLETLVGVITATCATMGSYIVPALAGLHWGRKQSMEDGDEEKAPDVSSTGDAAEVQKEASATCLLPALEVHSARELNQWSIAVWGLVAMISLLVTSTIAIVTTDYFSGNFFCEVVG